MPTGSELGPDDIGSTCHRCKKPLGPCYWIEDRRFPVHTACRDWSRVPFIFASQLRRLRRRRDEPEVARVIRWLERARAQWPSEAGRIAERGETLLRRVERR